MLQGLVWSWLVLAAPVAGASAGSEVTLPLQEYEALRQQQERPSITVVDTLRLTGSFKGRDLVLLLDGRASGRLTSEAVLAATGLVLHGCSGDGLVSRSEAGGFVVTPLAPRFTVTCRATLRGSDRVEISTTRAVLHVEAAVADGELVPGNESPDGARSFAVVRLAGAPREGLAPSALGRYLLSLRPDETRFRYQIEVRNPNRSRQRFDVALASGETVQQVDAQAPYDVEGARYRFDLPPGDSVLVLAGTLAGESFTPPITASVQYALLESHPLLRGEVAGGPRRVSPGETGVTAEFRGAQAFLLGAGDHLQWTTKRLEALRTTGYALRSLHHVAFIPAQGPALGETTFKIDNQGAADIALPLGAEATFASLGGEPVFLTKNDKGDLWLPLSQGDQTLVVQHSQKFRRLPGLAIAQLALPEAPVPATWTGLELRVPNEWIALYASHAGIWRFFSPGLPLVLALVLLFLWTERVLAWIGLERLPARAFVAAAAALMAGLWTSGAWLVVLADAAVTILVILPSLRRMGSLGKVLLGVGAAGVALVVVVVTVVGLGSRGRPEMYESRAALPASSPEAKAVRRMMPQEQTRQEEGDIPVTPGGGGIASYQGLPAQIQIPEGARQVSFAGEMVGPAAASTVRVLLLRTWVVEWGVAALGLVGLALLLGSRRTVAAVLRARMETVRHPSPQA